MCIMERQLRKYCVGKADRMFTTGLFFLKNEKENILRDGLKWC